MKNWVRTFALTILIIVTVVTLSACVPQENGVNVSIEQQDDQQSSIATNENSVSIGQQNDKASSITINENNTGKGQEDDQASSIAINELNKLRNEVVSRFRNNRTANETGKFIEDTYKKYPNDEIISTIYFYDTSSACYEYSKLLKDSDFYDDAIRYASKISPTYTGEFSDEIIKYATDLLGDTWSEKRNDALQQDVIFDSLTLDEKVGIYIYVQSRYDYYDTKEGYDTGNKYSDAIWSETSKKYGISLGQVTEIWMDMSVIQAKNKNIEIEASKDIEYDALLDYDGEPSLIAVSQDVLDRFLTAQANNNQGTISELSNESKVATVPVGTMVNIIEKKLGVAKVKILNGIYTGNEVWVLIESLKKK